MTKRKCIVCGIEYEIGKSLSEALAPCPNGHTIQEEIAVADKQLTEVPNSSQG